MASQSEGVRGLTASLIRGESAMGRGGGEWLRVGTVVGTEEGADDREEEEYMVKGRGNTDEGDLPSVVSI